MYNLEKKKKKELLKLDLQRKTKNHKAFQLS